MSKNAVFLFLHEIIQGLAIDAEMSADVDVDEEELIARGNEERNMHV